MKAALDRQRSDLVPREAAVDTARLPSGPIHDDGGDLSTLSGLSARVDLKVDDLKVRPSGRSRSA